MGKMIKDNLVHWTFLVNLNKNWSLEKAQLQEFDDSDSEEVFKF